jgi:hypothetical protein
MLKDFFIFFLLGGKEPAHSLKTFGIREVQILGVPKGLVNVFCPPGKLSHSGIFLAGIQLEPLLDPAPGGTAPLLCGTRRVPA